MTQGDLGVEFGVEDGGAAAPTAADIRSWSNVDFDGLGFDTATALQRVVDRAIAFVYAWTGAMWTDTGFVGGLVDHNNASMLSSLAEHAVQQLTEMLAFRLQEDVPETLSDFDVIQSFSAGGYSETRRDPRQAVNIGIAQLAILQSTLWPLMDEYHQDEWLRLVSGVQPPAFAVTEVNWGVNSSYGGLGGAGVTPTGAYPMGGTPGVYDPSSLMNR